MRLVSLLLLALAALADGPGRIESKHSPKPIPLTANPEAPHWRNVKGVFAEADQHAKPTPGHRTEIRSLWTKDALYILFLQPYKELYLKPDPSTTTETNRLWEWDVAEVFVGSDFENIKRYKEFQVSPQNEWIDLDIDRGNTKGQPGIAWNSGFRVKARIDEKNKIWYGEMEIPFSSIDPRPPKPGNELRINFYRFQGPKPNRAAIAWQPTYGSNHVPEAFGRLVLVK